MRTHICVYIVNSSLYECDWHGTNNPADASQTVKVTKVGFHTLAMLMRN